MEMEEISISLYTNLKIISNENGTSAVRDDLDAGEGDVGGTELGDRGLLGLLLALLLLPSLPFEADCRAFFSSKALSCV